MQEGWIGEREDREKEEVCGMINNTKELRKSHT